MRDKKKIFALVLFILMGFFMFTFANPSDGIDELTTPVEEVEEDTTEPVIEETPIQVNNTANQVIAAVDNAPVITVNPTEVKILRGTDYDVNIGVTIADDKDTNLQPTISMTSTIDAEVGTYTITYTVTDSGNNTATATRIIKVLEPNGDEDNDHYSNEEELANDSDFDDAEIVPEYDYAPSIDFSSCPTSMTVYDAEIDFSECATATDEYYETTGVELVINSNIISTTTGLYNVTFTATDNLGNQTDEELSFEVVKRELTVTINNKSSVYGSNLEALDYTITTGTENATNPAGINITSNVIATSGVGSYPITGTYTNTNYDVTFIDGTYVIGQKTLTDNDLAEIIFADESSIYDENEHILAITGTLPSGVTVVYSDNNSLTSIGSETVTATFTGSGNYTGIVTKTATLTVTAKSVVAVWGTTTFTYNGSSQVPTASFTDVSGNSQNLTVSGAQTNAGTYTATASLTDTNYALTNTTKSFIIEIKTLTDADLAEITFANTSSIYDGNAHSLAITGELPSGVSVDYTNNSLTNVGSKSVTAIFTGSGNYTGTVTKTATLAVTAKEVAAVWGTTTFTYNGSSQAPTASFEDVSGTNQPLTVSGAQTNVGTYTATASLSDTNYTLTNTTISFTIGIKTLIDADLAGVNFADKSSVYDGNVHSLVITGTLPSGVTVSYSDNNSLTSIGSETVTATFTGSGNYTGTVTKTATLAVTAKEVAAVWGTTTFTYNGSLQAPTATFTDVSGTIQNLIVSGAQTNVGTYTATASLSDTNYTLTNTTISFTIGAKTLTDDYISGVTFGNATSIYDGIAHSLATTGTLPSGVTVSYSANNSLTNVGSELVTATFTGSGNYTGTVTKTATLAVTTKSVAAVWGTPIFTYNGSSQAPTATFTDVSGTMQNLIVSGDQTNAGTYTATTSLSDTNYTLTNTTIGFTINKAVPSVPSVGTLTADERQHLNDIVLPAGFTFEDKTNPVLVIGNLNTNLVYTPSDTTNYATVILPVTITVNEKYFDVVFYDYDRTTELGTEEVERGHDATAPADPTRANYTFAGWSTTYNNITSDLNVYATYTANQIGISVVVNPNVQFQFQKGITPTISNLITVYKVYADGTTAVLPSTDYTAPVNVTTVTTTDRTLTITQKGTSFTDTSIKYSVIDFAAYQTKFEIMFNNSGSYLQTYSNECMYNCDEYWNTFPVMTDNNFLEIVEHYDEIINVNSTEVSYESGISEIINVSNKVRWTHSNSSGYYNPVYIGMTKRKTTFCSRYKKDNVTCKEYTTKISDIMNADYIINTVTITYSRDGYGTYRITFKYNAIANTFSAIDEVKVS